MRINTQTTLHTHEGARSSPIAPLAQLRRLTMACLLWEDTFYVDGKKIVDQISEACEHVKPQEIVDLAVEIHTKGLLRHIPLFLIVQALKRKAQCVDAIVQICTRPDQMTELLSLYWKDRKKPLAAQLKRGLAKAFCKFDEYQLAKYNRDDPIKLRDVLFMVHAKPIDKSQEDIWKRLIDNNLAIPDTWETRLSSGADKKESFEELINNGKLGKLATLRNLRNMSDSGISKSLVRGSLLKKGRSLLPFQYIAAAKNCPQWEDIIDESMMQCTAQMKKITGFTLVFVDVSGSMDSSMSGKSTLNRMDAACGISILLRGICEDGSLHTFSERLMPIPPRNGMALRDAIVTSQSHGGTYLGRALQLFFAHTNNKDKTYDRIIVITDEQVHDIPPVIPVDNCYIINVGSDKNGICNNGQWTIVSGFSENVIDYIRECESNKPVLTMNFNS